MVIFGLAEHPLRVLHVRRRVGDVVFGTTVLAAVVYGLSTMVNFIADTAGFAELGHALLLGLVTFGRVLVLVASGAQWYILFNVIAGASAIPNDPRESRSQAHRV
jgi:NitT/TauT family transport system permease protein